MSFFEFYALFGAPLLLLLVALTVVWLTRLQDAPKKPAEAASRRRRIASYAARMRGCSSRSMDGISLSGFGRLNK
jgi:hypothetical protein